MLLDFDIQKAIAATAYLIQGGGGAEDMFYLVKELYCADRSALINWGKSITGDSFAALEKGPIVSEIYDLLKNNGSEKNQIQWNDVIRRDEFSISLRKQADMGVLSEREMQVLDEARKTIKAIRGSIPKWCHKNFPEWTDPGKSSVPIDPSTILRLAGKDEEEIKRIEEANEEIRLLHYMLGTR